MKDPKHVNPMEWKIVTVDSEDDVEDDDWMHNLDPKNDKKVSQIAISGADNMSSMTAERFLHAEGYWTSGVLPYFSFVSWLFSSGIRSTHTIPTNIRVPMARSISEASTLLDKSHISRTLLWW